MNLCVEIRKNTYYDSVALMLITKEIKKMSNVKDVIVGMGTELNKELTENLGLSNDEVKGLTPNDFFIAVASDEENILKTIVKKVDELLNTKADNHDSALEYKPTTLSSAVKHLEGANMAVISLPGKYAAYEARRALNNNLHVMLFSDNVTVEEEIKLKEIGRDKGLLVMGPDCGTAIINGVPLCFANVVRRGDIGIVGASGTGTQEVTVIIDKMGGGVSQVIGTGGRDLKSQVGGIMMIEGFKALIHDEETKVIVLISKPPAPEVAEKILNMVKTTDKPVVACFIGGDRCEIEKQGAFSCLNLEDAARKAVLLAEGKEIEDFTGFTLSDEEIEKIVQGECKKFNKGQKYLRALYTGGTLADEAMKMLGKEGYRIYSNIQFSPELRLEDTHKSVEHTCIDLGDDDFTVGKPHPMIDPAVRVERLIKEVQDQGIAIVLMDFVLGYGSNIDPAGEMLEAIRNAKAAMKKNNKYLCVIGYVCGTEGDPQNYKQQCEKLEKEGVVLMPSNAQAVKLSSLILEKLNKI
ncbi:acyl-CoA synthetase FdrA [Oceanirhabdus sp. W0125-5]|uniref:acyl-CoA synthetase FdrA n=1 Tax=Oceanirhabdus sp. W0125-5 TaxID=2999116 RepID=UPI0022F2FA91|nr:acyl-CoA synthetase FdrA [Oceanirhabdus sp. W0125-5]WBW95213.1 acyl-CoA synthetase FdrA [Oceanirhabdus sp. W0125-5]